MKKLIASLALTVFGMIGANAYYGDCTAPYILPPKDPLERLPKQERIYYQDNYGNFGTYTYYR